MLETRHLRLISTIVEAGGLTRAAHRLHLTQSALSHQLKDIEGQLGTPLFVRGPRSMTLTESGVRLFRVATSVLGEIASAEKEIARATLETKRLTLTSQCCTVYSWLPQQLQEYRRSHPRVNVNVVVNTQDEPARALLEGEVDVVICCSPHRNSKLHFTPLFEDENVLVVPRGHRLANKQFVVPQDLKTENLLVYPPKEHSSFLKQVLKGIPLQNIQEVMLTEAVIEMIKAGLGVASLARWMVAPQTQSGTLVPVRIGPDGFWRSWSIATRRRDKEPPHIAEFVRLLSRKPFSIAGGRQRTLARVPYVSGRLKVSGS